MSARCGIRHDRNTNTRFWMPGCAGGAAMGDAYCTCNTTAGMKKRAAELAAWRDQTEARLRKLEQRTTDTAQPRSGGAA